MTLEEKFFEDHKKEWLNTRPGKWVWIHENTPEFFDSYEKAVETAYSKGYDEKPIFVKQILEKEAQSSISGIYRWAV